MAATKTQLLGGGFQDGEGNPLSLGYLIMKLSQDAAVSGVGNICSGIEIKISLDVNGNVITSPAQSVWANTGGILAPINTYYKITGYTAAGQKAWGLNNQQVAAGATFNLGSWVPNSVISWFPTVSQPTTPLAIEVAGTPFSSSTLLNFESSNASVTITDEGGGVLNFAASGGGGGALGKWPGNWFGANAPINGSALFSQGAQYGVAFAITSETTVNARIAPTATQAGAAPMVNDNATDSSGIYDNNVITWGILQDWIAKVMLVTTTACRYWIGLSDVAANPTTALVTNTPAQNIIGFRWVSGTDVNIKAVCQTDGTHQTIVDTGVLPTSTVPQIFEIVPVGSSITFYINGTLVATISTNVPTNTTAMRNIFLGDTSNIADLWQLNFYYFWEFLSD